MLRHVEAVSGKGGEKGRRYVREGQGSGGKGNGEEGKLAHRRAAVGFSTTPPSPEFAVTVPPPFTVANCNLLRL